MQVVYCGFIGLASDRLRTYSALMAKSTKYEIENRNARMDAVAIAVQDAVTKPWWGTMTELVELLRIPLPFPRVLTPRSLSATLTALDAEGLLGHGIHHWRAKGVRMVGLVPPGWVWDSEGRQWVVDGVPQQPAV